jgi:hypothetical protein
MSHPLLRRWNLAAWLFGTWLALAQVPAYGKGIDLDDLSEEQLNKFLTIELNDMFTHRGQSKTLTYPLDPKRSYPVHVLREAILYALSDADDDSDDDNVIDEDELAEEMEEANTTLEAVVDNALRRALMAAEESPTFVRASTDSIAQARQREMRPEFVNQHAKALLVRAIKDYPTKR